jgi:hypothetical protein
MLSVPLEARIATLCSRRDLAASLVQMYRAKNDLQYSRQYSTITERYNTKILRLSDRWRRLRHSRQDLGRLNQTHLTG